MRTIAATCMDVLKAIHAREDRARQIAMDCQCTNNEVQKYLRFTREADQLRLNLSRSQCDIPTLHRRRCHDCGSTQWHADAVTPYVLCPQCKSQDTRRVDR